MQMVYKRGERLGETRTDVPGEREGILAPDKGAKEMQLTKFRTRWYLTEKREWERWGSQ